jgi:hypothetical protein
MTLALNDIYRLQFSHTDDRTVELFIGGYGPAEMRGKWLKKRMRRLKRKRRMMRAKAR